MGNTRPECFKGSRIFGQKIRGLKCLGENLRGLKSISKFNLFLTSIFLEDTDPNIAKILTISEITSKLEVDPLVNVKKKKM